MLPRTSIAAIKGSLEALGLENVILAGGAPRDMYLGRTPRDYDFYVYIPPGLYHPEQEDFFDEGFEFVDNIGQDYPGSPTNSIISVWVMEAHSATINVIVLEDTYTPAELVENFQCSLSKFYYDFDTHSAVATSPARLAIATKRITFSNNCSNNYKQKISSYFPEYTHCTYEQIALVLIEQAVNSVPKRSGLPNGVPTRDTSSSPWWHRFATDPNNPLRGTSPGTIIRDEIYTHT